MNLNSIPRLRAIPAIAVLSALVLCSASCSNLDDTSPGGDKVKLVPPTIGAITVPVSGADASVKEPLAAFQLSSKNLNTILQAVKLLSISCMHQRGFVSYTGGNQIVVVGEEADVPATEPAGPWGYLGADTATRYGFHPAHTATPSQSTQEMGEDERTSAKECLDQSRKQFFTLSATPSAEENLVHSLTEEARLAALQDSRVISARADWATCMKQRGFDVSTPEGLASQGWGTPTDPPTADEIATAQADEGCTASTDLARVYFAALWGYQEQLIEAHAEVLATQEASLRRKVDTAARIVAAGSTG